MLLMEIGDVLMSRIGPDDYHHRLLCGHRGCGKSTELRALKAWADGAASSQSGSKSTCIFGLIELQFSDLYLLAARSVAREMHELGLPLPEESLKRVVDWFAKVTQEDLEELKSN